MSFKDPGNGEVEPRRVGPPDLILQDIVAALGEVPEEIRNRFETIDATRANEPATMLPIAGGRLRVPTPLGASLHTDWADVTFAGRALALVEGTDQPDYDDYGDPLVWVFALSAESPVLGEAIVSSGGYAKSSSQIRISRGEPTLRGKRVSFFAAIRTEPRRT